MIDWITAVLPCKHDPSKLVSGMVMSFDSQGNNEWVVNKQVTVEGSYSSKIQVKSHTDSTIWISGNPTKFLQGHNIFGTDDLRYLMSKFFDALLKHEDLGLCPTEKQYQGIQDGDYTLKRVDLNQSWHLKDRETVLAWIRAAGSCARLKHRGAGQYTGDTLYFGKNSRRWAVKCYSKGHEINAKSHKLPDELQIPELMEWADKALRIEIVIRSMQLKDWLLHSGKSWTPETSKMLLCSCVIDDLEITDNMALPDDLLTALPTRLKGIYALWLNGEDLRQSLPKNTFYRYRRTFLEHGIDISIVHDKHRNNIVPLVRYLEAQPAEIPQWAYEKNLVA
jgi:II/X family phage/plasmid replication protein